MISLRDRRAFAQEWMALNDRARVRICAVDGGGQEPRGACDGEQAVEGAYVRALLEMAPEGSCVFSARAPCEQPTGDGAVRFCVLRRAGTVGRARRRWSARDRAPTALAMTALRAVAGAFPTVMRVYRGRGRARRRRSSRWGWRRRAGVRRPSICTSGTAVANYYPGRAGGGVVARAARRAVGRPAGAAAGAWARRKPCDQVKAYGDARALRSGSMPAPCCRCRPTIAFARQAARACAHRPQVGPGAAGRAVVAARARRRLCAGAGAWAGPVQVNFPLRRAARRPTCRVEGLFEAGRGPLAQETSAAPDAAPCVSDAGVDSRRSDQRLDAQAVRQLHANCMRGRRALVAGGGGRRARRRPRMARAVRGMGRVVQRARCWPTRFRACGPLRRRRWSSTGYDTVLGARGDAPVARGGRPLRAVSGVEALPRSGWPTAGAVNVVVDPLEPSAISTCATDVHRALARRLRFVRSMAEAVTLDERADGLREPRHGGMREPLETGFPAIERG